MAWVTVLDNYTGAAKSTEVALLGGKDHTGIAVLGDLGGATGVLKALLSLPSGDVTVAMYHYRTDAIGWLRWEANEAGALNNIPCSGIKGLSIDYSGGAGMVAVTVAIRGKAESQ